MKLCSSDNHYTTAPLCIAESKLDELYLNGKITLEGFEKPYRLDVTASNGGFLIYVNASVPPKVN